MAPRPPTWRVVGEETELYGGAATAGAKQGGGPSVRLLADQIESSGGKHIGEILDEIGGKARAEPGAFDKAPPELGRQRQAASSARLSSAQSSRGDTSPRPTWRARTGQGSPSSSCS